MDLSLVICGIVMIFLISLEETTLQGSKVFSQFCGPEVKPIKTDLTLSTAFIPSQVKKKKNHKNSAVSRSENFLG